MDGYQQEASRTRLRAELMGEAEAMVDEAMGAMDQAPANNIIGGSEWGVQEAVMKAKKRLFEKLVQSRAEAAEAQRGASFSPSGQGRRAGEGQEADQQG